MTTVYTEPELRRRLAALPRLRLATLPTPLDEAPRLAAALGGPRLLIKRDDLTGVACGGNKLRQFEYSLAPAVAQGCDVLINSAGSQSNQSRQTAAAAARLGMRSILIARDDAHAHPVQGNLLLCHLLGAEVRLAAPERQAQAKAELLQELQASGHKPYDTGYDGAVYRSVAYVDGFLELLGQLQERHIRPKALYLCSTSHTQVGMVVAAKALGLAQRIVATPYSPRRSAKEHAAQLVTMASEAAQALGLDLEFAPEDMESPTDFTGPGHGVVTPAAQEAIQLAARTEGLMLDPVYTGKAMACLFAHVREGQFGRDETVVFLHTGGTPALFAYSSELGLAI